jgi:hypothetical protein
LSEVLGNGDTVRLLFKVSIPEELRGIFIGFNIGVGVKDFGAERAQKTFYPKLGFLAAHAGVVIGQVLRNIDCGNTTAAGRGLIVGIMFVQKVLRLIGPQK